MGEKESLNNDIHSSSLQKEQCDWLSFAGGHFIVLVLCNATHLKPKKQNNNGVLICASWPGVCKLK